MIRHVSTGLLSAVVVFAVLNVSAWYNFRHVSRVRPRQDHTRHLLLVLGSEVELYNREHGTFPESLNAIPSPHNRQRVDGWENPFEYRITETAFELYSLGRDGQPFGIGLNTDLYYDGRNRTASPPTFLQYFTEVDGEEVNRGGFTLASAAMGLVAFIVALNSLHEREDPGKERPLVSLFIEGLLIVLVASVLGTFLLAAHVPTGH